MIANTGYKFDIVTGYNFDIIDEPEIYFDSIHIPSTKSSLNNFINTNLTWECSTVGNNKRNNSNFLIRKSTIAEQKVQIKLNSSESNDIIDEFMQEEKMVLSENKSNISWENEHKLRKWDIIQYKTGDFFESHVDGKKESNHVGTIIIIPPKSIFDHNGGELVLICGRQEIKISSDLDKWFCVVFDTNIKHKVNEITSGTRIIFKSKLFKKYNTNVQWYDSSLIQFDNQEIKTITDIFFFCYNLMFL